MTPQQAAAPISDLQALVSIPLATIIVNSTDEENVLDEDDRINMEFKVCDSIDVEESLKSLRMS